MNKINSLFPIIDFPIIISEKVGYQKPQKEIFELILHHYKQQNQ